jgi:hypothetical protein
VDPRVHPRRQATDRLAKEERKVFETIDESNFSATFIDMG